MPWFMPSAKLLRQSLLVRSAFLLLLWLLVWEIGWLVEYTHHASVWYPVAGLTFAALLLMGLSAVPALLVGCVGITFYTAAHYQIELAPLALLNAGIAFGFAHIMPYALGALALRALTQHGIRDITTVIVCFLLIAAGSSLLATVLVLPTLVITDMMPLSDVEKNLVTVLDWRHGWRVGPGAIFCRLTQCRVTRRFVSVNRYVGLANTLSDAQGISKGAGDSSVVIAVHVVSLLDAFRQFRLCNFLFGDPAHVDRLF